MTLIIKPGSVENTDSTKATIGGRVSVGGNFTNSGKVQVFEGGLLNVQKDILNSGDISINDPERIKQIIIETVKTTGNLAEFGSELLKKLGLLR
jgi:hypothetical protein